MPLGKRRVTSQEQTSTQRIKTADDRPQRQLGVTAEVPASDRLWASPSPQLTNRFQGWRDAFYLFYHFLRANGRPPKIKLRGLCPRPRAATPFMALGNKSAVLLSLRLSLPLSGVAGCYCFVLGLPEAVKSCNNWLPQRLPAPLPSYPPLLYICIWAGVFSLCRPQLISSCSNPLGECLTLVEFPFHGKELCKKS